MSLARFALLSAALVLLASTLGRAQGVDGVAASSDDVTITTTGSFPGSVSLRELPLFPEDQAWALGGAGLSRAFLPGFMRLSITQPGGGLDPFLTNIRHIDAAATPHFAMRVRVTGGPASIPMAIYHRPWNDGVQTPVLFSFNPTGDWQTVRVNLAGQPDWSGFRRLRLDFAESQGDASPYAGAAIDIQWMAITNDPAFGGTSANPREIIWRFDHIKESYTGPLLPEIVLPRLDGQRDRAYARFQLFDAGTGAALGPQRHATDFTAVDYSGDDPSLGGWAPTGNGLRARVQDGKLVLSYFSPAPAAFDPYIQSQRIIDADASRYLYLRVTFANGPFTIPITAFSFPVTTGSNASTTQSVVNFGSPIVARIDLQAMGANWTGQRRLRIDLPDGQALGIWPGVTASIDWIALSNEPAFDGSNPALAQHFWTFTADRDFEFVQRESIKGLQVQMLDDAIELGVKEAGLNVLMGNLLDLSGATPKWTWNVDGHEVALNAAGFTGLDNQVSTLTDAGMNVTLIVLNAVPPEPDPGNPLINPYTDLENHPNRFSSSFNYTDEVGYRHTRAVMEALAARYSREDAAAGQVQRLIIGNEVNSHWFWYNLGEVPASVVVSQYSDAMRAADIAFRTTHPRLRAFISMDHFWNGRFGSNALRTMPGKTLIDDFNTAQVARGNYPWNLAHHPYPESLFEPDFWNDTSATFSFTSTRVTFKNVEVLPAYLGQAGFLAENARRRIIFSEQGFHGPGTTQGLNLQAAAYAYSYVKLSNMPELDAYVLHRHVDYEGEGGLDLGLWINDDSAAPANPALPVEKKPSWFVFQAADQPDWQETFDPFLPLTGLSSWEQALPRRTGIEFLFDDGLEQWYSANQTSGLAAVDGLMVLTATGEDPFLRRDAMFIGPGSVEEVFILMSATGGAEAQLFWTTTASGGFSESKSQKFPIIGDGQMRLYQVNLAANPEWAGRIITGLRLDPTQGAPGAQVAVDYLVGGRAGQVLLPGDPSGWILRGP